MITFYSGTDAYRLREAVRDFVIEHRTQGESVGSYAFSDEAARPAIEQLLKYPSFLVSERTLIVTDALADDGLLKLLREHNAKKLDDVHIVAVQFMGEKPTAAQKKKRDAFRAYASIAHVLDVFTPTQRTAWMQSFCKERGRTLEKEAATELIRRCASDTWFLANEMEKLCAYCDKNIDAKAVALLVPEPESYDQWELSNAAAAHDKRGMLVALFRHTRKGTPPPLLLGMIAGAVRTVLSISDLLHRQYTAPMIAQTAGIHPFVVRKHLSGARAYTLEAVRTAHQKIAVLDRDAKEGRADTIDGLFGILFDL